MVESVLFWVCVAEVPVGLAVRLLVLAGSTEAEWVEEAVPFVGREETSVPVGRTAGKVVVTVVVKMSVVVKVVAEPLKPLGRTVLV